MAILMTASLQRIFKNIQQTSFQDITMKRKRGKNLRLFL